MNPQLEITHNVGNVLKIANVIPTRVSTYLSEDYVSGNTLHVDFTGQFTNTSNLLLLIGDIGITNSEIVYTDSKTDKTFVFTTNPKRLHSRGEKVSEINYDTISIEKSPTKDGVYTSFLNIEIQTVSTNTMVFDATGLKTDYYRVCWKNSKTNEVSGFSPSISPTAADPHSAEELFNSVKAMMGISEKDSIINTSFLLSALKDARDNLEQTLYGVKHAWKANFEFPIKLLAGRNFVYLPDDIDFNTTDRALLNVRFNSNNVYSPRGLTYIDKQGINNIAFFQSGSITKQPALIGATSIEVLSVGDFSKSGGTAIVSTNNYSEDVITIEYTGIDTTTNTITGVSGLTRDLPVDTQIWQSCTLVQPIYYTVYQNKIVFNGVIPPELQGMNVYIDYYKKMEDITNVNEVIPEDYREIYKPYLRWAIKYRKDNSLPTSDPDLVKFNGLVESLVANLYTGQTVRIIN